MTVEQGAKLPKKETSVVKNMPLVSEATALLGIPIADRVLSGKAPKQEDVEQFIGSVADDLRKQGVPISSDDIRAIEERTKQSFQPISPHEEQHPKQDLSPDPVSDINLNEYKDVMNQFAKTYGLNKGAWETISGISIASILLDQGLDAAYRVKVSSGKGWENLSEKFENASNILRLKGMTPGVFGELTKNTLLHRDRRYSATRIGQALKRVWEGAWPIILHPVGSFIDRQGRQVAGKLFFSERANLQEQVNNRIADSLYMRNFEFLHDKSSAEMLDVLNHGKDATVDLVSAVYENLIPLKASQWGALVSQALVNVGLARIGDSGFGVNMLETALTTAKKLLLDTRIKPNAMKIRAQRAEELKQWDKVNTKLMMTLQGLETVRTAGNAEGGSDVLFDALAERDFVEAGGLREKRMQDKQLNEILDIVDTVGSVGIVGKSFMDFITQGTMPNPENPTSKIPIDAKQMMKQLAFSGFRFQGTLAAQKALRQSYLELTHLYTDRIIPDLQDISRMEELLGPYEALDHPVGLKEQARTPVTQLKNFDIKVTNLNFKHILHNVSLDIPQGTFVTIKGPSGIGKSTLFRHLVDLYQAESGAVTYGGVDIHEIKKYGETSLRTKIAYAPQNPLIFEDMTFRQNLLLWTRKKIPDERVKSVLQDLHLDHLIPRLDDKTKHFSGGELRRIGIARALLKDPKILFLDEPTANLDAVSTMQVLKIIQELRNKRPDMTVVAITHDPVFERISEKIVDFEKINKKPDVTLGDNQVLEAVAKPQT